MGEGLELEYIYTGRGGDYCKIIIGSAATFTTPLPTLSNRFEVVDLRSIIPAGDYNRTQLGITIPDSSLYGQEIAGQTTSVPVGTSLQGLIQALPKNLTGPITFNLNED
jgi:hypothetical protein